MLLCHPYHTLFPYTPLFRSIRSVCRCEAEASPLLRPLSRGSAEGSNTDPARETALNRCCDQARCLEGEGDGHINMAGAAMLPGGEAFDRLAALDDFLKPETAAANRSDESRPAFGLHGPGAMLRRVRRQQDFPGGPRWLFPGHDDDARGAA